MKEALYTPKKPGIDWSEERFLQIEEWLKNFEGKSILEIGVGDGLVSKYLSIKNKLYDLDIDINILKNLKFENSNYLIRANAIKMPVKPKSFDIIICREVIEHLSRYDGEILIDEIYNILKPDGILIISTPNRISVEGIIGSVISKLTKKNWNAWDPSHRNIYNIFEFKDLLEAHNLSVDNIRGIYYTYSPIDNFLCSIPYVLSFFKFLKIAMDKQFGRKWPANNLGFIVEYFCIKRE